MRNKITKYEAQINSLKNENMNLITEINSIKEDKSKIIQEEMNFKNQIDLLLQEINNDKNIIEEKNEIIQQMKDEIGLIEAEHVEKNEEFNEYERQKEEEINEYTEKIEEILNEKILLEEQNKKLISSLAKANENLKQLNDLVVDKYSNMEYEIYKQREKKKNMEKKYKGMIKQIKSNEKNIIQKNNELKELLSKQNKENQNMSGNEYDVKSNYNMNNTNGYDNKLVNNNIMNNNIMNYNMESRIEDPNDFGQRKTLEEFKNLLKKIDEKLDINQQL